MTTLLLLVWHTRKVSYYYTSTYIISLLYLSIFIYINIYIYFSQYHHIQYQYQYINITHTTQHHTRHETQSTYTVCIHTHKFYINKHIQMKVHMHVCLCLMFIAKFVKFGQTQKQLQLYIFLSNIILYFLINKNLISLSHSKHTHSPRNAHSYIYNIYPGGTPLQKSLKIRSWVPSPQMP